MGNFVIYNSSAGSGKTFTLVKEYLKLALATNSDIYFKKILAITFTNKAASEMKERVIATLKQFSKYPTITDNGSAQMMDILSLPKSKGGIGIEKDVIARRSKKLLANIIHNYNSFGVSTIDKFTLKIVKTFAYDLNLDLNFEIELNSKEVLQNVIDELINQVGKNPIITEILVGYAKTRANEDANWRIEDDIKKFAEKLLTEKNETYINQLRLFNVDDFKIAYDVAYAHKQKLEQELKKNAISALEKINQLAIDYKSFYRSYYPKYLNKILDFKRVEDLKPNKTILDIVDGNKDWYAKNVDDAQKVLIDANKEFFIEVVKQLTDKTTLSKIVLYENYIHNFYNFSVLIEIEKLIEAYKKDNAVYDFKDFNKKISDVVLAEPIPFIYERVGEHYAHFLIDEFQDTSVVQWHNLIPLIDNSLANSNFNMVVGDAKQSIYRFRGGEVEQFISLPKVYKNNNNPNIIEREKTLDRNHKFENLNTNYRSKEEIVSFNNHLFKHISKYIGEPYQQLYKNLNQGYRPNNKGGEVRIQFIEKSKGNNNVYEEEVLESINNYITELTINKSDGYSLKDITILVRANDKAVTIASYLLNKGVKVVSSESLLLINNPEVNFITNLFYYFTNPNEKLVQVKLLNFVFNNNHKELYKLVTNHKNPFTEYLKENDLQLNVKHLSLYELTEYVIELFQLNKTVNIYIQFFLEQIYNYTISNDNSVINFLRWWDKYGEKKSIVIPEGTDAVNIMTIHKSKGLEFPVVIYPFANETLIKKGSKEYIWANTNELGNIKSVLLNANKDLELTKYNDLYQDRLNQLKLDLFNLLYVTLTRPVEKLYIISSKKKKPSISANSFSTADLLYDYCAKQEFDGETYLYGDSTLPNKRNLDNDLRTYEFNANRYNNWRNQIKISYQAPDNWDINQLDNATNYGNIIHALLSEINCINDVVLVINRYLIAGKISSKEAQEFETLLNEIILNDKIKFLFDKNNEVKNEREIITSKGRVYRPDRILISDDRTIVVDYKTGKQEKTHIQQVENYKILLNEMGYNNIEGYLLYISNLNLIKV